MLIVLQFRHYVVSLQVNKLKNKKELKTLIMKKILLSIIALVACVCNVMAEDILWSEDFSSYAKDAVPAGGAFNYVCVGAGTKVFEANLAGGTSPELLIAKSGGSFSVTIPTNGKSGDMTLAFNANYDRITVTVTGGTLGDKQPNGTSYTYPVSVTGSAVTITFTNSTSSNVRFDNAKLYQGVGKKAAGLSWGTASRTVTIGSEENQFPTLTNNNGLAVSYASDNTDVATINAEGVVTLVAAGKANISAVFAGNNEYEAQTVSYELTVKAPVDPSEKIDNTPETAYTTTKAIELIEAGKGLNAKVYVAGTITKIDELDTGEYGNATYYISDGTNELEIYRGYGLGGEKFTSASDIKVGDAVIVYGKLVDYNGTKEMTTGSIIYSLNGVTGINDVVVSASASAAYNLAGQRVNASAKGIVIIGGKKYINK